MNKKTLFSLLIISMVACNTQSSKSTALQKNDFKFTKFNTRKKYDKKIFIGEWMKDCKNGTGNIIIPKTLDTALMEITFNQIQIDANIEIESNDTALIALLKLDEPYDLGSGGATLHWKDFSKDSVIARISIIDTSHANLIWYGFYDKKLKKRIWTDNFDIFSDEKDKRETIINKCGDFVFTTP